MAHILTGALKVIYEKGGKLQKIATANPASRTGLNLVKQMPLKGRSMPQGVIYSTGGGVSGTISQAQSVAAALQTTNFDPSATVASMFRVNRLTELEQLRIQSDNELLSLADMKVEAILEDLFMINDKNIFADGFNSCGVIGSISTTTITLTRVEDVANFQVGGEFVFPAAASNGTLRDSGASRVVASIDEVNGTVTMTVDVSTIASIAAGDHIVPKGLSGTTSRTGACGFEAWAAQTGTILGVDVTAAVGRLSMLAYTDGYSSDWLRAIKQADAMAHKLRRKPRTHCFMNPDDLELLASQVEGGITYTAGPTVQAGIGHVNVNAQSGMITCVGNANVASNKAYLVPIDSWRLGYFGPGVAFISNINGGQEQWVYNSAEIEFRGASYTQMFPYRDAPGHSVAITVS